MKPTKLLLAAALMTTTLSSLAGAEALAPPPAVNQPPTELRMPAARPARETRPRIALAAVGGSMFVSTYFVTAFYSAVAISFQNSPGIFVPEIRGVPAMGFIPLVGPMFLAVGNDLPLGWAIAGTSLQTAGALMAAAAFIFPERLTLEKKGLTVRLLPTGVQGQF